MHIVVVVGIIIVIVVVGSVLAVFLVLPVGGSLGSLAGRSGGRRRSSRNRFRQGRRIRQRKDAVLDHGIIAGEIHVLQWFDRG